MKGNADPRDVANGYAALSELRHFSAAAMGNARPFDRCVFLPLPPKAEGISAVQELASLAGDFLSRELTTTLGRVADEGRSSLQHAAAGLHCQTFGAYWFSVPRRPLLRRVVQQICDRVVRGWQINDANALSAAIAAWANDELTQANLTSEALTNRLQEACGAALGQPLNGWYEALTQGWAKGGPSDVGQGAVAVRKAMQDLEELLGPPEREPDLELTSPLITAFQEAYRSTAKWADAQLGEAGSACPGRATNSSLPARRKPRKQLGIAWRETARCYKRRTAS